MMQAGDPSLRPVPADAETFTFEEADKPAETTKGVDLGVDPKEVKQYLLDLFKTMEGATSQQEVLNGVQDKLNQIELGLAQRIADTHERASVGQLEQITNELKLIQAAKDQLAEIMNPDDLQPPQPSNELASSDGN